MFQGGDLKDQMLKSYIDQVFDKYDTDRSGTLDQKQMTYFFNDLFKSLGMSMVVNEQQALEAIKSIDQNFDGSVDKGELFAAFKAMINTPPPPPPQQPVYNGYGGGYGGYGGGYQPPQNGYMGQPNPYMNNGQQPNGYMGQQNGYMNNSYGNQGGNMYGSNPNQPPMNQSNTGYMNQSNPYMNQSGQQQQPPQQPYNPYNQYKK